jgi:sulfite reductase beta subunit-like hemoprotein
LSWELFDGPHFNEVYMVTGEWEVRARRKRVRIRIVVDRNGIYRYKNSITPKYAANKKLRASPRGYKTQEEALSAAIREISRMDAVTQRE